MSLFFRRLICLVCSLALTCQSFATVASPRSFSDQRPPRGFSHKPSAKTNIVKVGSTKVNVLGVSLQKRTEPQLASLGPDVTVLVSCLDEERDDSRYYNVTAGCAAYSVFASGPVSIGVPYDPEQLPEGASEGEIRLFATTDVAIAGPMAPIDSYLDLQNKQTVATLAQQSGRFISAVLRPGERPEKPPSNLSHEALKSFRQADPMRGVPIIAPPQPNNNGDLQLTYPFDLPGVRENFRPQVSVGYSAQSSSGNIALGWNLSVPAITVETRWGVPIYDPNFETEVYLFNGKTLVPEAGDYFVDPQPNISDAGSAAISTGKDAEDRKSVALNLVPLPYRSAHLRPRKMGTALFVMRRDEGLWRFVRHGDNPSSYWWEAWQENPSSDVVRVMYFGRAPGRLADEFELPDLSRDMVKFDQKRNAAEVDSATLRVGPMSGLANAMAISKWGLSRERDSFGNVIDYDWITTCLLQSGEACTAATDTSKWPSEEMVADRDIYLKRVLYTGHQQIEETILRCREQPDAAGCRRRQGLYEVNFFWTPDDKLELLPLLASVRTGGVSVPRRLLERAEVRFRRRQPDGPNAAPIQQSNWTCSSAFLAYEFHTRPDPLYPDEKGARRWLDAITKHASRKEVVDSRKDEDSLFPPGLALAGGGCDQTPPLVTSDASSYASRFKYSNLAKEGETVPAFGQRASSDTQLPGGDSDTGDRIKALRDLVTIAGIGGGKGPFAGSKMGTVETESFNAGLYVGVGGPIKGLSGGYKFTSSKRTSHNETSLFADINGDGIPDVISAQDGGWVSHLGAIDKQGNLSFGPSAKIDLPHGFRFQYEPVMEATSRGPEAHTFGVLVGNAEGHSHTVQTVQLADMDGDGRVDIVTPDGVFYNTTTNGGGGTDYRFTANTPFLLNGTAGQPPVAPVATPVPLPDKNTFPAAADHPRYDTVRTWRAPFRGLVRVTGQARLVAPDDDPDEVWGVARSETDTTIGKDALPDKLLPPAHRDGVIVGIERSSGTATSSCGSGALGSRVIDRLPLPRPGGPGLWTLLGTRVASRDEAGSARLDYRLSVSGRKALGAQAAAEKWESAIVLKPRPTQTSLTPGILEAGLQDALTRWNDAYGKDATGQKVGELTLESLGGNLGLKLRFKGSKMPEMPALRFSVTLPSAAGVTLAALELDDQGDASGTADRKNFSVETRVVERSFDAARNPACAVHPELTAAEDLLQANGVNDGLIVNVQQGDILYFRVHSIDNGDDDVVNWVPQISYLLAEDEVLSTAAGLPNGWKKLIGPGLPQSPDVWIAELAKVEGSACLPSERPAFCNSTGKSLLRYRLSDNQLTGIPGDFAPLAVPNAGFIAPMTGAVEISGDFQKPVTVGPAFLDYVVVPVEVLATRHATHIDSVPLEGGNEEDRNAKANGLRNCDADVTRAGRTVAISGLAQPVSLRGGRLILEKRTAPGVTTTTMDASAGGYTIRRGRWSDPNVDPLCHTREGRRDNPAVCGQLGNEFDIRAGDKVCLFVRSQAPQDPRDEDTVAVNGFWPIDAAGFRISNSDAIALHYNTELAAQAKEAATVPNTPALLDDQECISKDLGDRPRLLDGTDAEPLPDPGIVHVCRSGNSKHYLIPTIQHGSGLVSNLGHVQQSTPGGAIRVQPTRADGQSPTTFRSRLTSQSGIALPAQTCSWGVQKDEKDRTLFERRFVIDLRGIAPEKPADGSINLLQDPSEDPTLFASRLGDRIAKVRSRVLAFRDGQARELQVKRFATFAERSGATGPFRFDLVPVSDSALAANPQSLPDGRQVDLLYDATDPTTGISQVLRFIRGETGTVAVSPFVERRESASGTFQSRTIELPSTQAGFAVCAAEDEEIVVESALDDRVTDGGPETLDQVERLLGTDPCTALSSPDDPASTQPLLRDRKNICPLGTATIRLATISGPDKYSSAEPPLALAHRSALTGRKTAAGASTRWRMPYEALTDRGVAAVALRNASDDPSGKPDFRDPIDACADQNLATPLPQGSDDFAAWQLKCKLAPKSVLASENPAALTPLSAYAALRDAMDAYNAVSANPTDAEKMKKLHPPALVLVPEQRYPTPDSKERRNLVKKQGTEQPAIATRFLTTSLCGSPAVPRGPEGMSQPASPAADDAIAAIAANSAINPLLENRATWATQDVQFQAATGSQVGMPTHQCMMAPDSAIWVTGEMLSSSRYGVKDIEYGSKSEAYSAALVPANPRLVSTPSRGAGLSAPSRRSDTTANTDFFSLVGITNSTTSSTTRSEQDVVDLNGDGYPDTIVGNSVVLTDPRGGSRCGSNSPWIKTVACKNPNAPAASTTEQLAFSFAPVRSSSNRISGSSFGFPEAKKSAEVMVASARAAFTGSMSGLTLPDKGQRTQESYFPWNLAVDQDLAKGTRLHDVVDVNGDGLPDIVQCNNSADCANPSVFLNLGNKFDKRELSAPIMMADQSQNVGLGLSIGWAYPLNDNSFEGGSAGSSNTGDITRTFLDVNGDGLSDIVAIDPSSAIITAKLNTGWGFTTDVKLGKADFLKSGSFGRSETDNASAGGAYTYSYCWPVPPICIHINPNAGLSGALTRQSIIFRDADGDGLADFVAGDSLLQGTTSLNIAFSRTSATVVPNRLGQQGLLTHVWQPTNPSNDRANLEFSYSRTGKTVKDPQHRWVMSEVTVRDGIVEDDAPDVTGNSRRSCFAYADGMYDRFERQFLGYGRVDIVEGCNPTPTPRKPIEIAGADWDQKDKGVRRTERKYANGSVYETGLMVGETVFDTSAPGGVLPVRTLRQTYVLVDTALSTHARVLCHHLRSTQIAEDDKKLLALGFVRNISVEDGTNVAQEIGCRTFRAVEGEAESVFDSAPRRLTSALVQSVRETRENGSGVDAVLRTAQQYDLDYLARMRRACDLGEITVLSDEQIETSGAVCTDIAYDESVRPQFTHGATGGGTILVEQHNRIKDVRISDFAGSDALKSITGAFDRFKDGGQREIRLLRRRSASHDPQTGMVSTLCEFADPGSASDPCAQFKHFPTLASQLKEAANANIVMRVYHYDEFGNLDRFVGPAGSGGTYVAKAYAFDGQLALVETAERTEHCTIDTSTEADTICLSHNVPALGKLRSFSRAVDYRHAMPTLAIDLNGNATYAPVDELGRPKSIYVNWSTIGPDCASPCAGLDPAFMKGTAFHEIATYAYQMPDYQAPSAFVRSPAAIVRRQVDVASYATLPNGAILSKTIHDHFGDIVQMIEEADVCIRTPGGGELVADCGPRHNYVASGIVKKDRVSRAASGAYPISIAIASNPGATSTDIGLAAQQLVPTDAGRNTVAFDGLDRPLTVALPDGNAYDFRYRVARQLQANGQALFRHRTDMRDAMCVPSAVERDVRGTIRAVIESYNPATVEGQNSAAVASNVAGQIPGLGQVGQPSTGLVASVSLAAGGSQQVYACNPARGEPFDLASKLSIASYDRDALGQLVAVRLPARGDEKQVDAILSAYDPLGRRVLIDDPDRGFERIVFDGADNAVCAYSGARRGILKNEDRPHPNYADILKNACADPKPAGGANLDAEFTRVMLSAFLGNLPTRNRFKLAGSSTFEREITTSYGEFSAANQQTNSVGRAFKTTDMVGDETREFDAIGRPVLTKRSFAKLAAYDQTPDDPLQLRIEDEYDVWGPHKSRTMTINVPGKAVPLKLKPPAANIKETVSYRYTPAGQLTDISGISGPSGSAPPALIASSMNYDARGNLLFFRDATDVTTVHAFDAESNRLVAQRARLGVSGSKIAPIYFQNLTYRYDPAGNVLSYDNLPVLADQCPASGCVAPDPATAKAHGLLISRSKNSFAYDQLNRIRSATKSLVSLTAPQLDFDGEPDLLDPGEINKATKLTLDFEETFAFRPTHEMALLKRAETRGVQVITPGNPPKKTTKKSSTTFTSVYATDGRPRHAPGSIDMRYDGSLPDRKTKIAYDEFGRMKQSACIRTDKKGCWPDHHFEWYADDALRLQIAEISPERLPERKKIGLNKGIIYYDRISSEYDATGRRTYKSLTEQRMRKAGVKVVAEPFVSDTLYADPQLTVTRREGQKPEAIVHYFAGQGRLASKWVGDDRVFTYHAQMMPRSVTDIVVGKLGSPATARLNGQKEYAAFGEILHQREILLAGNKDGVTSGMKPGLPRYRFNAKEQDESGLQDFGARFYDNRLALWLRPDPALGNYLNGEINDGVYYSRNLASYGFSWGNPANYSDRDGLYTCANESCNFAYIDERPALAGTQFSLAAYESRSAISVADPDFIFILTSASFQKDIRVSFINDRVGGASPRQPITRASAEMIEKIMLRSGLSSVNINSTSGGTHDPSSRHFMRKAVDINRLNGVPVQSPMSVPAAAALQKAAANNSNIRENFGPTVNEKTFSRSQIPTPWPQVAPAHRDHIHLSGQD